MLRERIEEDFRQAMKAHDAGRVSVLRLLRSAIVNAVIAARTSVKQSLDDADVENVIRQEAKKLKDALQDFTKAARHDLVVATQDELAVLQSYLPSELGAAELEVMVSNVAEQVKKSGVADFGRIMGAVMREVKGRADGETVAEAVRRALAPHP